jgi:hypothetical protein
MHRKMDSESSKSSSTEKSLSTDRNSDGSSSATTNKSSKLTPRNPTKNRKIFIFDRNRTCNKYTSFLRIHFLKV